MLILRWARTAIHRNWVWLLIVLCVSVVAGSMLQLRPEPAYTKATWIWNARILPAHTEEIVAFAKQNEINLIYVHVEPTTVSPQVYRDFIRTAKRASIQVEALGGDPNWALAANRGSIGDLVSWVKAFNHSAKPDERFQGIHVDIEPYLLAEWKKDQDAVVEQWMKNVVYLVAETKKDSDLLVGADLPFWIDSVIVPGEKEKVSNWMVERLDSITLMAYRNHAMGQNGIIDIVHRVVADADSRKSGSVVVGVNILESKEGANTSFHADGTVEMEKQLAILQEELAKNPSFAGSAIHDYESWLHASKREE